MAVTASSTAATVGLIPRFSSKSGRSSASLFLPPCPISPASIKLSSGKDCFVVASCFSRSFYNELPRPQCVVLRFELGHGLVYGTRACCGHGGGAYNFDPKLYRGNKKQEEGRILTAKACKDPHKYVRWDGIHTSEAANKLQVFAILNGSYFDPPFPLHRLCHLNPLS